MIRRSGGWFLIFVYASLAFVVYTLVRGNYLVMPQIRNGFSLAWSLVLLLGGFFIFMRVWRLWLQWSGCEVSGKVALAASGLSVLGKYIPGKIWVVAGRAEYVCGQADCDRRSAYTASLAGQLVEIATGLCVGGLFLLFAAPPWWIGQAAWWLCGIAILAALMAWQRRQTLINLFTGLRLWRRRGGGPSVLLLQILLWSLFGWTLWSYAFYLFAESLYPGEAAWYVGFAFALAGTLGILAILFPGGIGVREGLLIGLLAHHGLTATEITTLSVASRLWFLVIELTYFSIGWWVAHTITQEAIEAEADHTKFK